MIADLADFFAVVAPPSASLGYVAAQLRPEAEPAPLLRLRPLRPPLSFLRRRGTSILPAGDRQNGSRCAPFLRRLSLPCGQPASASHRLSVRAAAHAPYLRRFSFPSVSAELISGRFPPVRSAPQTLRVTGESGTLARPGTAPFLRLPLRGFSLRRLRQNPLRSSSVASPASADLRFPPLRSLPGNLPVLRTASAGSGGAPLRQIPFQSAPLQRLLAAPAPASGCSVPLRGTASAGSGRTPFVLTPPLRPAQAQARSGSASGQPASPFPPSAGHSAGSVTGTPASAPWAD